MLQLNIKQFVAAVQETAPFALPEMNMGTSYLYKNIFIRLSNGEEPRLSELDFSAFDSEDITTLNDLYENVFEDNNHKADGIANILRKSAPVCKIASYV